jgi:hypothetical protein
VRGKTKSGSIGSGGDARAACVDHGTKIKFPLPYRFGIALLDLKISLQWWAASSTASCAR